MPPFTATVQQGLLYANDWRQMRANHLSGSNVQMRQCSRWIRPVEGFLRCNLDGALLVDLFKVGVGGVIRDY